MKLITFYELQSKAKEKQNTLPPPPKEIWLLKKVGWKETQKKNVGVGADSGSPVGHSSSLEKRECYWKSDSTSSTARAAAAIRTSWADWGLAAAWTWSLHLRNIQVGTSYKSIASRVGRKVHADQLLLEEGLEITLYTFSFVCMHTYVCVCAHVCTWAVSKETRRGGQWESWIRVPAAGVTGSFELPNVGAKNWTQILRKNNMHS